MNSKNRVGIGSVAIVAVLLIGGGFALADSGAPQPANINPNKAPALSSSNIKPQFAVPLSVQQQIEQSKAWASQEPNTRLVCFKADGSVAGMAILELVDPSSPLSATATAEFCNRTVPGSHS